MRDWEKEGVRGQNGQGDERLGERGRMDRGMRDWEGEGRWAGGLEIGRER